MTATGAANPEPLYRHRQRASLPLLFAALALAALVVLLLVAGAPTLATVVLLVFFAFLAQFWQLTVTVTREAVRIEFGWGLIHRTVPTDSIKSAKPVRNRWYYGWGIRLYPGGWLYNVAGLDAVEVVLSAGRKVRIGTDEPAALTRAIEAAAGRPLRVA